MRKINLSVEEKNITLDFDKHFAYLARINQAVNKGATEHYQKSSLTYVDVPAIVGITGACENIDTLFKINNRLGIPLFFTQTGQLALEQSLQSFPGVYTVIHSGRDEEEEDERHLRQFRLTEEEFDCSLVGMKRENYDEEKMFEALLTHIQKAVQAMIKRVLTDEGEVLEKVYRRNIKLLEEAARKDFLRIEYSEAINFLNKKGDKNLSFGDDLKAEDEAKIVKFVNNGGQLPVFITRYPKEIKFFNMKVYSKDPRVVLSADLIFPYAGEGTGSAVREHDFERLNRRLLDSTMFKLHLERGGKYEDFRWYLDIIKKEKTNPHAGYGIGNERVLQYIFAEKDIRKVSLFSLLASQTGDWQREKKEQIYHLLSHKKSILLAIGKTKNKKILLPFIKKLANSHYLLCATEKTHKFLKKHGVITTLVYKISQKKKPNLYDLLKEKLFDVIVNIPTRAGKKTKEFTDGEIIRRMAVENGITLVTDIEVAQLLFNQLANFDNKL